MDIGVGAQVGFGQAILVNCARLGASQVGPIHDHFAQQGMKLKKNLKV